MFYKICRAIALFLARLIYKIEITGQENLPSEGGYIAYSNHLFFADPVFLTKAIGKKLTFMAKGELFKRKLLSKIFLSLGSFPVERGKGDTGAIEKAIASIKNGEIFAIYPEGTRSKTGELGKFKAGLSMVAAKTGANLLPVVMSYSKGMKPGSRVTVKILPIVKNEELPLSEANKTSIKAATGILREKIEKGLEELRND